VIYDWPSVQALVIDLGSGVCSRGAHVLGWSPDGRVLALGGIDGVLRPLLHLFLLNWN